MGASGDSTGVPHSCKKFLLIRARVFAGEFYFDIQGATVTDAMPPYIGLAVLADTDDRAVLGIELPYRMVSGYAAVLTERHDDFVL